MELKNGTPIVVKVETIRKQDGEVQLNRQQGEMKMRLYFASQKRVSTTYKTPYGVIPIETLTNKINISKKDMPISAKVEVDYLLYSQEKIVGEYKIRLQFTA